MNDRQLLAFRQPIVFGQPRDETIFERVTTRKGLKIRTKLIVQAPVLHRAAIWICEGSVVDDASIPLPISALNSDQRRILSVFISELIDDVGSGKKLTVSRTLSRKEFEELAEILNDGRPLPEIKHTSAR